MASKTQIDKLGDRLRKGEITEAELLLLDEYRRSFSGAYEFVVGAIRNELGLEPTGRPAKSTTSISEKLQRESIRLTQVQDIAGCRIIVPSTIEQQDVVETLQRFFDNSVVVDRRKTPSHGYRAVHIIVRRTDKLVEIQVRTLLQHAWSELSEKFSDIVHPSIKYGGGNENIVKVLLESSRVIALEETNEIAIDRLEKQVSRAIAEKDYAAGKEKEVYDLQREIQHLKSRHMFERQESLKTLKQIVSKMQHEGEQ